MNREYTSKELLGINKKSFELPYNNGSIWCEHLDSMGELETEVIAKFSEDKKAFTRPSVSSYMIICLNETIVTKAIVEVIYDILHNSQKRFSKVVFVGVPRKWVNPLLKLSDCGAVIQFTNDYERAKEMLWGR